MSDDATPPDALQVEAIPVETIADVSQSARPDIPDVGYLPLQDYLGIKTIDTDDRQQLQFIWNSFAKGRDRAETLQAIKEAQMRLTQPEVGEKWLQKLYNYTRLIEEGRSIDKERKVYEQ
jgi:hypothetical protein